MGRSRDKIAYSVDVNGLTYCTIESNQAIENTIYNKNVIDKKVNVKIKEGRKKGDTVVGAVTRSLKPNWDKFPYSIIFDPKDNLKDEQVDKIPDKSDGKIEEEEGYCKGGNR